MYKKSQIISISLLIQLFWSGLATGQPAFDLSKFVHEVSAFYKSKNGFRVAFEQTLIKLQPFRDEEKTSGTLFVKHPKYIRWNMREENKHYINVANDVWVYDVLTKQTTFYQIQKKQVDTLLILFDFGQAQKYFKIELEKVTGKAKKRVVQLMLTPLPKMELGIKHAIVQFAAGEYIFKGVSIKFDNGNLANYDFKKVEAVDLDASLFKAPK